MRTPRMWQHNKTFPSVQLCALFWHFITLDSIYLICYLITISFDILSKDGPRMSSVTIWSITWNGSTEMPQQQGFIKECNYLSCTDVWHQRANVSGKGSAQHPCVMQSDGLTISPTKTNECYTKSLRDKVMAITINNWWDPKMWIYMLWVTALFSMWEQGVCIEHVVQEGNLSYLESSWHIMMKQYPLWFSLRYPCNEWYAFSWRLTSIQPGRI